MIDGALLIGGEARQAANRFTAVNPASGETLTPDFSSAGTDAVAEACALADAAFPIYAATDPATRAAFLEAIADNIVAIGDPLIERAMAESEHSCRIISACSCASSGSSASMRW